MLPEPSHGYKLFATGLLFIVGAFFALTVGISLITGNRNGHDIFEAVTLLVFGLSMMIGGSFLHWQTRKGRF